MADRRNSNKGTLSDSSLMHSVTSSATTQPPKSPPSPIHPNPDEEDAGFLSAVPTAESSPVRNGPDAHQHQQYGTGVRRASKTTSASAATTSVSARAAVGIGDKFAQIIGVSSAATSSTAAAASSSYPIRQQQQQQYLTAAATRDDFLAAGTEERLRAAEGSQEVNVSSSTVGEKLHAHLGTNATDAEVTLHTPTRQQQKQARDGADPPPPTRSPYKSSQQQQAHQHPQGSNEHLVSSYGNLRETEAAQVMGIARGSDDVGAAVDPARQHRSSKFSDLHSRIAKLTLNIGTTLATCHYCATDSQNPVVAASNLSSTTSSKNPQLQRSPSPRDPQPSTLSGAGIATGTRTDAPLPHVAHPYDPSNYYSSTALQVLDSDTTATSIRAYDGSSNTSSASGIYGTRMRHTSPSSPPFRVAPLSRGTYMDRSIKAVTGPLASILKDPNAAAASASSTVCSSPRQRQQQQQQDDEHHQRTYFLLSPRSSDVVMAQPYAAAQRAHERTAPDAAGAARLAAPPPKNVSPPSLGSGSSTIPQQQRDTNEAGNVLPRSKGEQLLETKRAAVREHDDFWHLHQRHQNQQQQQEHKESQEFRPATGGYQPTQLKADDGATDVADVRWTKVPRAGGATSPAQDKSTPEGDARVVASAPTQQAEQQLQPDAQKQHTIERSSTAVAAAAAAAATSHRGMNQVEEPKIVVSSAAMDPGEGDRDEAEAAVRKQREELLFPRMKRRSTSTASTATQQSAPASRGASPELPTVTRSLHTQPDSDSTARRSAQDDKGEREQRSSSSHDANRLPPQQRERAGVSTSPINEVRSAITHARVDLHAATQLQRELAREVEEASAASRSASYSSNVTHSKPATNTQTNSTALLSPPPPQRLQTAQRSSAALMSPMKDDATNTKYGASRQAEAPGALSERDRAFLGELRRLRQNLESRSSSAADHKRQMQEQQLAVTEGPSPNVLAAHSGGIALRRSNDRRDVSPAAGSDTEDTEVVAAATDVGRMRSRSRELQPQQNDHDTSLPNDAPQLVSLLETEDDRRDSIVCAEDVQFLRISRNARVMWSLLAEAQEHMQRFPQVFSQQQPLRQRQQPPGATPTAIGAATVTSAATPRFRPPEVDIYVLSPSEDPPLRSVPHAQEQFAPTAYLSPQPQGQPTSGNSVYSSPSPVTSNVPAGDLAQDHNAGDWTFEDDGDGAYAQPVPNINHTDDHRPQQPGVYHGRTVAPEQLIVRQQQHSSSKQQGVGTGDIRFRQQHIGGQHEQPAKQAASGAEEGRRQDGKSHALQLVKQSLQATHGNAAQPQQSNTQAIHPMAARQQQQQQQQEERHHYPSQQSGSATGSPSPRDPGPTQVSHIPVAPAQSGVQQQRLQQGPPLAPGVQQQQQHQRTFTPPARYPPNHFPQQRPQHQQRQHSRQPGSGNMTPRGSAIHSSSNAPQQQQHLRFLTPGPTHRDRMHMWNAEHPRHHTQQLQQQQQRHLQQRYQTPPHQQLRQLPPQAQQRMNPDTAPASGNPNRRNMHPSAMPHNQRPPQKSSAPVAEDQQSIATSALSVVATSLSSVAVMRAPREPTAQMQQHAQKPASRLNTSTRSANINALGKIFKSDFFLGTLTHKGIPCGLVTSPNEVGSTVVANRRTVRITPSLEELVFFHPPTNSTTNAASLVPAEHPAPPETFSISRHLHALCYPYGAPVARQTTCRGVVTGHNALQLVRQELQFPCPRTAYSHKMFFLVFRSKSPSNSGHYTDQNQQEVISRQRGIQSDSLDPYNSIPSSRSSSAAFSLGSAASAIARHYPEEQYSHRNGTKRNDSGVIIHSRQVNDSSAKKAKEDLGLYLLALQFQVRAHWVMFVTALHNALKKQDDIRRSKHRKAGHTVAGPPLPTMTMGRALWLYAFAVVRGNRIFLVGKTAQHDRYGNRH